MEFNYVSTSTLGDSDDSKKESINENQLGDQLDAIKKSRHQMAIDEGRVLERAFQSSDPDILLKANSHWEDVQQREGSGTKSDLVDPNAWTDSVGYKSKAVSMSYGMLRKMAITPVIKAIISTRQTQVSAFSSPQKNKYETGFVVRKKKEFYTEEEPKVSNSDKQTIKKITQFIISGGEKSNAWHGDSFDSFLKKVTADSLTIDQGCFEVVRNRKGIPTEYLAVDGATFRIADSYDDDKYSEGSSTKREKIRGYYPSYVQVIDGIIKNEYYPWELCFGIRNTTTDIYANGYGKSEVEELVSIITWMLYADSYNGKFFSQGSSPKGMIKVSKGMNRNRLAEFRQQWISMVAGVQNAWKMPIIEAEKMDYIDLQKSNTDMQFAQWQEYLIKIACAIFKIAPEEVGFNLGNASGGGAMFEGNGEAKIKYSRDKGLKPLLKSIEFWINKWIVNAIDEDFEFKFVGLEVDTEEAEVELDIKKVGSFMGFKEARRKHNLPEELEEGDFTLNPQYIQMIQSREMKGEQEENGQAVEEEFEEDSLWDNLETDDEVIKSMFTSEQLSGHQNNPMMADAFKMLME
jgi:hypothetical protein